MVTGRGTVLGWVDGVVRGQRNSTLMTSCTLMHSSTHRLKRQSSTDALRSCRHANVLWRHTSTDVLRRCNPVHSRVLLKFLKIGFHTVFKIVQMLAA